MANIDGGGEFGAMDESTDNVLIYPFFNQTKDYALGFELGRLDQQFMGSDEEVIQVQLHGENEEQAILAGARRGWTLENRFTVSEGWVGMDFVRGG